MICTPPLGSDRAVRDDIEQNWRVVKRDMDAIRGADPVSRGYWPILSIR
jgi:hypothetical protein